MRLYVIHWRLAGGAEVGDTKVPKASDVCLPGPGHYAVHLPIVYRSLRSEEHRPQTPSLVLPVVTDRAAGHTQLDLGLLQP